MIEVLDDFRNDLKPRADSIPTVTPRECHAQTTSCHDGGETVCRRWLDLLLSRPSRQFIRNVNTRWALLTAGESILPVTVNEAEYDNSYVCSPHTAFASYPYSELARIPGRILPAALRTLLRGAGPVLRAARIDQAVCVNNWLMSTNLYPEMQRDLIPEITGRLVEQFPSHTILMRSLNAVTNPDLCERLVRAGYLLVPSRQIYLLDGRNPSFLRRPNVRYDRKLLNTTKYSAVPVDLLHLSDVARIEHLHRLLYLEKYSPYNPQLTEDFIHEILQQRLLAMWGLRRECGRLDGVVGLFERGGVMTIPLFGYDTTLPVRLGLYRMLMSIAMSEASRRGLVLNLSSGASHFKRLRGAEPCQEFTAVYCRHLSLPRRAVWQTLALALERVGAPLVKKYNL